MGPCITGDWDSGNAAFAISRGPPGAPSLTSGPSRRFPGMLLSPSPFRSRSAIRPKNLPSSSSRLGRGYDKAPRGAHPPIQGVPRIADLAAERAIMVAAGDTADDFAALLRRQPRLQRRADQLIPEQRHLLRPLPAFHRVLIVGVHHVPGPLSSSGELPDRCCRAMTLATIPDRPGCRQGELVLDPAPTALPGQPGERSRPPDDAAATCHAVTRPRTPAVPNLAITAAAAAPNATSTSRHGDPMAFGTARSTPASRATSTKCTRPASPTGNPTAATNRGPCRPAPPARPRSGGAQGRPPARSAPRRSPPRRPPAAATP